MDLLIAPYTVTKEQADTAPATGTPGWATDGNPATNMPATQWPAYAFNAMQEELVAVIHGGGQTLNRNDNTLLLQAIRRMIDDTVSMELRKVGHGGRCRLAVVSPTSLVLSPYNGNQIIIDGLSRQIPIAGVSISNSGLPANALRYVYAYSSGGVVALELSPTGHSLGPNGVEVKAGDPTRSLVGMIYTTASAQFADSPTQRFCANWFNRRLRAGVATLLADTNFSTVTSSEITASLRVSALYWSNSGAYSLIANGSVSSNTAGGIVGFEARVNGGVFGTEARSTIAAASQYECLVSASQAEQASEGLITATAYGYVSAGSIATLYGTATVNLTLQC